MVASLVVGVAGALLIVQNPTAGSFSRTLAGRSYGHVGPDRGLRRVYRCCLSPVRVQGPVGRAALVISPWRTASGPLVGVYLCSRLIMPALATRSFAQTIADRWHLTGAVGLHSG